MKKKNRLLTQLSRRERQIMDILFRREEASAADVLNALPDPPSYSAVRALLNVLEEKGFVRHVRRGRAYIYSPTAKRSEASKSALKHVVQTFFDDSVEQVVATLISMSDAKVSDEEYKRLEKLIKDRRTKEKKK